MRLCGTQDASDGSGSTHRSQSGDHAGRPLPPLQSAELHFYQHHTLRLNIMFILMKSSCQEKRKEIKRGRSKQAQPETMEVNEWWLLKKR